MWIGFIKELRPIRVYSAVHGSSLRVSIITLRFCICSLVSSLCMLKFTSSPIKVLWVWHWEAVQRLVYGSRESVTVGGFMQEFKTRTLVMETKQQEL